MTAKRTMTMFAVAARLNCIQEISPEAAKTPACKEADDLEAVWSKLMDETFTDWNSREDREAFLGL